MNFKESPSKNHLQRITFKESPLKNLNKCTYHRLEGLSDSLLLLIDNITKDPEAGVEEGNEEEDGIQHANEVEELAFSLPIIQLSHHTYISIRREGIIPNGLRHVQLLLDKGLAIWLHSLQLFVRQRI